MAHIADGGHASCLLAACVVFVIAHDHHIICHYSLLLYAIVVIKVIADIIIYGQRQPVGPTCHGELPDELDEILSALHTQLLEVHIDAVDTIGSALRHQLRDQILSAAQGREEIVVIHTFLIKIIHHCPYLPAIFVGIGHIIRSGIALNVPGIIHDGKPGRRHHIYTLGLRHHALQGAVARRPEDAVPDHVHLSIQLVGGILRLRIIRHRGLGRGLLILQLIALYIAYEAVCCLYLIPVLQSLQHLYLTACGDLGQDVALYAAQHTDLGILLYRGCLHIAPLGIDLHAIRLCKYLIRKIGILLHKVQRQIQRLPLQSGRYIFLCVSLSSVSAPGVAAYRYGYDVCGQCVEHQTILLSIVKAAVQHTLYRLYIHIIDAVDQPCMVFRQGILQNNRHILLVRIAEIIRQIRHGLRRGIVIHIQLSAEGCP